ncbi:MAG: hypothetical protein CXT73_02790 [Methanobacteriota archaeon]|jgi:hypothetical protein|nr:MAG: hypothetical protein CXT73_02790 [Euryarchaeota archaeon]
MREVVTAKGKVLNMSALASANETEIAVGNMDVNARGDVLKPGRRGEIIIQNEEVQQAYYDATKPASEEVSIKQEPVPAKTKKVENTQIKKTYNKVTKRTGIDEPGIVDRRVVEKSDGTVVEEIEFSDGSIKEEEV